MQTTTPPKKAVEDQLHTKVLLPYFEPKHWESNNLLKTQNRLYEKAIAHDKSTFNKVRMFLTHNVFGWIWSYISNRFWFIHRFQTYDGTDKGIYQLPNEAKVTLLADWASFTDDSAEVARQSAKQHPDLSIHLGDIYFVGHKDEIKENFDDKVWHYGKMGSLAIPGNHEMYANGYDYFDVLLPEYMSIMQNGVKQQQKASFFCVENDHWRIVALDTGYKSVSIPIWEMIFPPKADLNKKQRAWIENELKLQNPDDKRGIGGTNGGQRQ